MVILSINYYNDKYKEDLIMGVYGNIAKDIIAENKLNEDKYLKESLAYMDEQFSFLDESSFNSNIMKMVKDLDTTDASTDKVKAIIAQIEKEDAKSVSSLIGTLILFSISIFSA